jgi:hypothetical protein
MFRENLSVLFLDSQAANAFAQHRQTQHQGNIGVCGNTVYFDMLSRPYGNDFDACLQAANIGKRDFCFPYDACALDNPEPNRLYCDSITAYRNRQLQAVTG